MMVSSCAYLSMNKFPKYREPVKLNVGSGSNPERGYINIDNRDLNGNMVWDVRGGLPFPDDSVDEIISSHFLEHLTDADSIEFLRECLRVLKRGKTVRIIVPHVMHVGAFYPGHLSFWNEQRVDAIQRLEHPLPEFEVLQDEKKDGQLFFTFKKV